MIITYTTEVEFYSGICELVKIGLSFKADGSNLTVRLTGGY